MSLHWRVFWRSELWLGARISCQAVCTSTGLLHPHLAQWCQAAQKPGGGVGEVLITEKCVSGGWCVYPDLNIVQYTHVLNIAFLCQLSLSLENRIVNYCTQSNWKECLGLGCSLVEHLPNTCCALDLTSRGTQEDSRDQELRWSGRSFLAVDIEHNFTERF